MLYSRLPEVTHCNFSCISPRNKLKRINTLSAKMASIFEKEPIFSHKRPWDDTTKLPEKYKFSGRAGKAEVHVDSGTHGMEFFYDKTLPDFIQAVLSWTGTGTRLSPSLRMFLRAATKLPGARL